MSQKEIKLLGSCIKVDGKTMYAFDFGSEFDREENLELTFQLMGFTVKRPRSSYESNDALTMTDNPENLIDFKTSIKLDLSPYVEWYLANKNTLFSYLNPEADEEASRAIYYLKRAFAKLGDTLAAKAKEVNDAFEKDRQAFLAAKEKQNLVDNSQPVATQVTESKIGDNPILVETPVASHNSLEHPFRRAFDRIMNRDNQTQQHVAQQPVVQQPIVNTQQPVVQQPVVNAQGSIPVHQGPYPSQPKQDSSVQKVQENNTGVSESLVVTPEEICMVKNFVNLVTIPEYLHDAPRAKMIKRLFNIFSHPEVINHISNKQPLVMFNITNFVAYNNYRLESGYPGYDDICIIVHPAGVDFKNTPNTVQPHIVSN